MTWRAMDGEGLDRYYTPALTAERALAAAELSGLRVCADSACGEGSLLRAAQRVWGEGIICVGLDKDRGAIRRLKRQNPSWILSVADVLKASSAMRARAIEASPDCDVLVLNPPFSMRDRKSVEVEFRSAVLPASVAMAHILRSIELYRPASGVVAVVPESLLFSEVDATARTALDKEYKLVVLEELRNSTFRGARANAAVVRLVPAANGRRSSVGGAILARVPPFELIRGGVPLFEARGERKGLPLVHSTDLESVVANGDVERLRRVRCVGRGVVSGAVILLPRVGVPRRFATRAVFLRCRVQLSDCVIALRFAGMADAREGEVVLAASWRDVERLYRGTGARYVTVRRLGAWLSGW